MRKAIGVTINKASTVLSIQMKMICGTVKGISVDKMQGTSAEKKIIAAIETTPITKRVTNAASATINEGRNISAIPTALAFAASIGSGS